MKRSERQRLAEAALKYAPEMLRTIARAERQKPRSKEQWLALSKRLVARGVIVWRSGADGQRDCISFDLTKLRGTLRMDDLPGGQP